MKRLFFTLAATAALVVGSVQSQVPAAPAVPNPPAAAATPVAAPGAARSTLQQLQTIRDANAKLLEQQGKTLLMLDDMLKEAQQLKTFAKRA